jgi:hypothetical protein
LEGLGIRHPTEPFPLQSFSRSKISLNLCFSVATKNISRKERCTSIEFGFAPRGDIEIVLSYKLMICMSEKAT